MNNGFAPQSGIKQPYYSQMGHQPLVNSGVNQMQPASGDLLANRYGNASRRSARTNVSRASSSRLES